METDRDTLYHLGDWFAAIDAGDQPAGGLPGV